MKNQIRQVFRSPKFLTGFVIYHKKFKIDEAMYAQIVRDLKDREAEDC